MRLLTSLLLNVTRNHQARSNGRDCRGRREIGGIESLEPRIAPAGLVSVSIKGGILNLATVAGQDGDEIVSISNEPNGAFLLTPAPGVILRFEGAHSTLPLNLPGPILGLNANLGSGADSLTFDGTTFVRGVKVTLGEGSNNVAINNSHFGSTFAVIGGSGADTVSVTSNFAVFGGNVMLKMGNGANNVSFGSTRLLTANAIQYTGGIGNDVITIAGDEFAPHAMKVNAGAGINSLTSTAASFRVTQDFVWSSLDGADTLDIGGDELRVSRNLSLNFGDGATDILIDPTAVSVTAATKIKAGSSGVDESRIRLYAREQIYVGPLSITAGKGYGLVDVFYNGSMFLGRGASISVAEATSGGGIRGNGDLISRGSVTLACGGTGSMALSASSFGQAIIDGSVTIKAADARVSAVGVISGSVVLTAHSPVPGATVGASVQSFSEGLRVSGNLSLKADSAADQLGRVFLRGGIAAEGSTSVVFGAGNDFLFIGESTFAGAVKASLGAGNDRFSVDTDAIIGGSLFRSILSVVGGTGSDEFELGGDTASTNTVSFLKGGLFDGGTETDTFTAGTQVIVAPGFELTQKNIP